MKNVLQRQTFSKDLRLKAPLILSMALFAITTRLWAVNDYGSKYWSPTDEVETPHIKWTKPDAQGPLKVLFIVSRLGMREVVELAQRMDLQYTVFAVGGQNYNLSGFNSFLAVNQYEPDRARDEDSMSDEFESKLDGSYDLIVAGNVNLNTFPLFVRYKLMKKVKDGIPLVFSGKPDEYFKRATVKKIKIELPALIPFRGLPAFAGYKSRSEWLGATVDYAEFGKGKILTLRGYGIPCGLQEFTPGPMGDFLDPKFVEYDYYLAWLGHLLRYAAGRKIVRVTGDDYIRADRNSLNKVQYFIAGLECRKATCSFVFRNEDNRVINAQEKQISLSDEGTAVEFEFPKSPSGRYFADLWVKENGKTWGCGSSFIELTGSPFIHSVDLRKSYRAAERISGKVTIDAKQGEDSLVLVLRQWDAFGRMVAESRMDVPSIQAHRMQEIDFAFSGQPPLTIVQYLEVELRRGGDIFEKRKKVFLISDLFPKDDIRLIGWCCWQKNRRSYLAYRMFDEIAKAGFDTQYERQFNEIPFLYNLFNLAYATHVSPEPGRAKHVRQPCLTDPAYGKKLAEQLTKCAKQTGPFSTAEFSMGDECRFGEGKNEICFSPTCVASFRKFLSEEYRSINVLNQECGTAYKTFDEIVPIVLETAKKERRFQPLWVDFRRHMETVWAGIYSYGAEVIRKVAPIARVGYEGSDTFINSYCASDFYKLMKVLQVNNTYDGAFVPYAVKCFAQQKSLIGLGWYGGYNRTRCAEFQRYIAWRHLFRGANSFWIFTADACGQQPVMAPDLSLYDFFKPNANELKEIKNGIGKLLMTAKYDDDGIAILYSASSVHVSTLTERLPAMENVLNALTPLFEDAGCQFRIISYEQLAQGELKRSGVRLLWLPYVQAMSLKEAEEVRAFVEKGGTVIADLRPGVRDEHGKPYSEGGTLDDVFGVKQKTEGPIATKGKVHIKLGNWSKTLMEIVGDGSLEVRNGKAHAVLNGEYPALMINSYGNGKAILLNFSLADYAAVAGLLENSAVKAGENSSGIQELFEVLVEQSKITRPIRQQHEVRGTRLYRFAHGGLGYLGILQELPEPPAAYVAGEAAPLNGNPGILELKEKKHVYDMRLGKYLGHTDRIKTMIEPAKALMFALLPYKVEGVKVRMPNLIGQGEIFKFDAEIEGASRPGLHVFHADLVSPEGEKVPCYGDNFIGHDGKVEGKIHLALNEPVGEWKFLLKDVATGITATGTFVVEKRKE
ncbi:MAG: beta-galactosidase trimerization domain-containing protein [Verrucomicrobiae bacterium]|nr:beta-galactosidase trimerization domain-containing protein [Verrucomicrobiae bacterium]